MNKVLKPQFLFLYFPIKQIRALLTNSNLEQMIKIKQ